MPTTERAGIQEQKIKPEQRFGIRKPISIDIFLVDPRSSYAERCKTKDLSLKGAFVERKPAESASPNAATPNPSDKVDAVLLLKSKQYRVPAEIVRVSGEGAAVKFRHCDIDTYGALVNLLYAP